jgi:uncharacterized protein YqgQ
MFDLNSKGIVTVKPELLLIKEFKELWKTDVPDKVIKVFAYIYFKNDFKSPYRNSYTENEIESILKEDVLQNKKWKPTKLVLAAEKKYQELQQTKSLKTLQSAENALAQINLYFNEFNISEVEESSKHQVVNNMMKNLKELDEVISKIENAKKRVEEELTTRKLTGKKTLRKRELPKSQR